MVPASPPPPPPQSASAAKDFGAAVHAPNAVESVPDIAPTVIVAPEEEEGFDLWGDDAASGENGDFDLFADEASDEDLGHGDSRTETLSSQAEIPKAPLRKMTVIFEANPAVGVSADDVEASIRAVKTTVQVEWGFARKIPLGFGVHRLRMRCTVSGGSVRYMAFFANNGARASARILVKDMWCSCAGSN